MTNKTRISVTNMTNHGVGFSTMAPSGVGKIRRKFNPYETLLIPYEELERAMWQKGSRIILEQYLRIDDTQIANELFNYEVEPEYSYTKEDVKRILLYGTLDEIKDMIDFGNEAIKDNVKAVAIEEKLDSLDKRKIILDMIGFDVSKYLDLTAEDVEEGTQKKERRVHKEASSSEEEIIAKATKQRRAAEPPVYNVISK